MPSDAARLEALNEPEARFVWRGHPLTIPRALEDWPLDLIRGGQHVDAAVELLNGQTAPVPLYGDLVDLSVAMATAVGVELLPESKKRTPVIFGAIPLLLNLIDAYEDDIAADLKRFYGVEYADRWRGDLTLRQIWTYIRRSDPKSALAIATNGGHELWTKQSIITAQVWEQIARKTYAGRPLTREEIATALAAQRENEQKMAKLKAKEDYYSPEATRARMQAAAAAAGAPSAHEPPAAALSALDKAVASRRRELTQTPRKAG